MILGALLFYQFNSWRNRLLARLRRLRQPKYLAGAIVGGLYFYFYLFRGIARAHQGGPMAPTMPAAAEWNDLPQTVAALALLVAMLLSWILPHARAALAFTEAEVAFLFPAPISRKTLIHFKLLKSQTAILFSALLMSLIARRWSGGHFATRALGWWAILSVFNLHLLGSSFALTRLMERGLSTWKRRLLILGPVLAVAAAMFYWARQSLPPFPSFQNEEGPAWILRYIGQVFASGPLPYLLSPFRPVVAPYFAVNYTQFLAALVPALGLIALLYLWVIRADVAFEEASVELSRKLAERIATIRASQGRAGRPPKKAARPPFVLHPLGPPAVAVFWKNLISAGQFVTARVWLMLVWGTVVGGLVFQSQSTRIGGGLGGAVIVFVAIGLAMSLFSGPQMLRNDLRQDLPAADMLKMFPLPGWQIVLGEILAPAAMLAAAQWVLIILAAIFCPAHFNQHAVPLALRMSVALAAAMLLPFIDLIALLIPNASVLFFPAWFQLGKDAPRGFETMGQQLILMFGQMLVGLLALLPASAAFALIFFLATLVHWPLVGLVIGAMAAAVILAAEAGLGIKILGGAFERFDLSGELV